MEPEDRRIDEIKGIVNECLVDFFCSSYGEYPFSRLDDSIQRLCIIKDREEAIDTSIACLDKFEDYMKNIDRLNSMVNELKGVVAQVRSELTQVKNKNAKLKDYIKVLLQETD